MTSIKSVLRRDGLSGDTVAWFGAEVDKFLKNGTLERRPGEEAEEGGVDEGECGADEFGD